MTDMASIACESFSQAVQSFQDIAQTAARLQEETVRGLQEMCNATALPAWHDKAQAVVDDIVAVTQKNAEETLRAMEQNLKAGMELWKKAFAASPDKPQPDPGDKMIGVLQAMVGTLHTNAEAMMRANSRIIETWKELGKTAGGVQSGDDARARQAAQAT